MSFISNPWFIGVGGGILSGFFVTVVTRYLFSRRDNREYLQRVVTANQEVLYAVRPGISEGVIPSQAVLESLVKATGQKYAVDHRDLNQASDLADVLTKEVMDSSFLSASAKAEFCERLSNLEPKSVKTLPEQELPSQPKSVSEIAEYRKRMVHTMSVMLGIMTAMMTATVGFLGPFKEILTTVEPKNILLLTPTLLSVALAMLTMYSTLFLRMFERKRERMRDTQQTEKKEEGY
ncbi:MAG: hypothetical protein ACIAQZ_06995 [Sedimentisphaeraceae bacterium JB056]